MGHSGIVPFTYTGKEEILQDEASMTVYVG